MAYNDEFDYRMAHEGRRSVMEDRLAAAEERNAPEAPAPDRPGPIGGQRQIPPGAIGAAAVAFVFALIFIISIAGGPPAALPDVPALAPVSPWVAPALDPATAPAPAPEAPTPAPVPTGYIEPVNPPAPAQAAPVAPVAPVEAPPAPAPVVYSDLVQLPTQAPEAPGWHAPMAPGYDPGNYVVNPEARP